MKLSVSELPVRTWLAYGGNPCAVRKNRSRGFSTNAGGVCVAERDGVQKGWPHRLPARAEFAPKMS